MREERAYEILRGLMTVARKNKGHGVIAEHEQACAMGAAAVAIIAAQERRQITEAALEKWRGRERGTSDKKAAVDAFLDDQLALIDIRDARKEYDEARRDP